MTQELRTPPAPLARHGRQKLLTGGLLGAAVLALGVWHPSDSGTPLCPFRLVTGLDCPGCGGLRCIGDLARGDVIGAADQNLLVVLTIVLLPVVVLISRLSKRGRLPAAGFLRSRVGARVMWLTIVAVVVVWWVVRNLPGVPFLGSGIG